MKKSRIFLWLFTLALILSGLVLFWLSPTNTDDFPHPLSYFFRQVHGWTSAIFLLLLGYMISDHMQKKWRRQQRRIEGILHLSLWLFLLISGWLIYYPPEFFNFEWIKWSHIISGFLICVFFPVHSLRKYASH
jgi:hypothetical protein